MSYRSAFSCAVFFQTKPALNASACFLTSNALFISNISLQQRVLVNAFCQIQIICNTQLTFHGRVCRDCQILSKCCFSATLAQLQLTKQRTPRGSIGARLSPEPAQPSPAGLGSCCCRAPSSAGQQ